MIFLLCSKLVDLSNQSARERAWTKLLSVIAGKYNHYQTSNTTVSSSNAKYNCVINMTSIIVILDPILINNITINLFTWSADSGESSRRHQEVDDTAAKDMLEGHARLNWLPNMPSEMDLETQEEVTLEGARSEQGHGWVVRNTFRCCRPSCLAGGKSPLFQIAGPSWKMVDKNPDEATTLVTTSPSLSPPPPSPSTCPPPPSQLSAMSANCFTWVRWPDSMSMFHNHHHLHRFPFFLSSWPCQCWWERSLRGASQRWPREWRSWPWSSGRS